MRHTADITAAAYHEAGHAIVGEFVGKRCRWVVIYPDDSDLWGVCAPYAKKSVNLLNASQQWIERSIIFTLAGPIAEEVHRGEPPDPFTIAGDKVECNRLATYGCERDPEMTKAYLHYLTLRTRFYVGSLWPAIETLAALLLERAGRRVPGSEVARIIAEARGKG